ncbi:MAG TPA: SH3 domain-containing protein, partial [Candidatus Limnocylindrales bacterium]
KLGIGGDASPSVRLLVSAVSSAAGVTMLMAFLFFGKRRRDGEPPAPDEVLSAAAARGTGQAATAGLVPDGVPPAFVDPEAMMPRWRRPSLLEARKMDPLRSATAASTQSFEHGAVGLVDGYERRLIRYHVVRLLDKPDELNATEIGVLSHGDEVQLLERASTYWRVLCPDGQQGWIHKMTLGEVVGATPPPSARDTWATNSVQAEEVDDDVLMAFMTARGRA